MLSICQSPDDGSRGGFAAVVVERIPSFVQGPVEVVRVGLVGRKVTRLVHKVAVDVDMVWTSLLIDEELIDRDGASCAV